MYMLYEYMDPYGEIPRILPPSFLPKSFALLGRAAGVWSSGVLGLWV